MTPKQLAKLIVQYHETKNDPPDPKCGKCKGTGIYDWYGEEEFPCSCIEL